MDHNIHIFLYFNLKLIYSVKNGTDKFFSRKPFSLTSTQICGVSQVQTVHHFLYSSFSNTELLITFYLKQLKQQKSSI